jgi:hypothetical protein
MFRILIPLPHTGIADHEDHAQDHADPSLIWLKAGFLKARKLMV